MSINRETAIRWEVKTPSLLSRAILLRFFPDALESLEALHDLSFEQRAAPSTSQAMRAIAGKAARGILLGASPLIGHCSLSAVHRSSADRRSDNAMRSA